MIDLDKLSALEKAATPGPWYAWRRDGRDEVPHSTDGGIFTISKEMCVKNWQKRDPSVDPFPLCEEVVVGCTEYFSMPHQYQTFEFIAEMRNQLPDLIACIADLEKRSSDLEARIGHEQVVTMQDREAQLQRYIRELEARHQLLEGYPGKGVRALEILKK